MPSVSKNKLSITLLQMSYIFFEQFLPISNHRSKSWTQALGCFDLMPVARNTSTYLHVASCVVVLANITLIVVVHFQVNKLLTLNMQNYGCQKRERNKTWRVLEKITCSCEAIPLL